MTIETLSKKSLSSVNSISIGTIIPYCGSTAPIGWLICNGGTFNSEEYPLLANLVGNTYSASSGTTYYLPDLRGRAPIGSGTGVLNDGSGSLTARALGSTGGTEFEIITSSTGGTTTHGHTTTSSGSVTHANSGHTARGLGSSLTSRSGTSGSPGFRSTPSVSLSTSTGLTFTPGLATYASPTAGHNNMQASMVVNFIIKAA
jgi:microcystin-dependent protein